MPTLSSCAKLALSTALVVNSLVQEGVQVKGNVSYRELTFEVTPDTFRHALLSVIGCRGIPNSPSDMPIGSARADPNVRCD